jgi:polyferredoxin
MNSNKVSTILPILIMALITVMAGPAWAANAVAIGDFQIQIFTDPDPLIARKEASITLKMIRIRDHTPVRGARILLSPKDTLQTISINGLNFKDISEYTAAGEADEFGNYELRTIFSEPDTYYIKVAIIELAGNIINEPLTAGFAINVHPPDSSTLRLLFILFTILLVTLLGLYLVNVRTKVTSIDAAGLNFLDIPWIKKLLQSKYVQPAFQIPLLGFLSLLIILAFIDIQDSGKNLATILIWTIWWAGIIFTFVLVGRLWCFMCPVGALTEWTSRIFKPHRLLPKKLRNLWLANFMFLMLTWLDIQIGVVRNPVVTGSILIGIIAIALLIGMFFQRRSFCRYLCPIGSLIGIYAMFSAVELRSKDCAVCKNHKRKDCYLGTEKSYGCPMFEVIPNLDSNNLCNFCGECIKSCPKNNITLRIRSFFKDAWTTRKKSLDEAALAVVLVGISIFVTGDMLEPWAGWMESAVKLLPVQLLGINYWYTAEVITKSILYFSISLLFIPGMILLAAVFSNKLVGTENHKGLKQTFITFGYMFIPIGLAMHLAHNTGHLLNESGGVIPAFQRAINKYTPFYVGEANWRLAATPLIDLTTLYWIQMGLFLIFYIFSLYAGYRLAMNNYDNPHISYKALMPMILISFVLMAVNVYLLNLPMAPRHLH